MEEKYEIVQKAMTDLDGIEARLRKIWPDDKPVPNRYNDAENYCFWYNVRSALVHIADLRCDLDGVLDDVSRS